VPQHVKTDYLLIQQPPGAKNWCIGCTGRPTPVFHATAQPTLQPWPDPAYLASLQL